MKKWVLFPVSLILLFSWAAAQDKTYYDYSYARMSYVSGDTYVQRAQDLGLEAGTVNLAVISGDMLGTREGRLAIHFGEQNYLRMDRHTQVDVIQLPTRNLDFVKLHLKSGEVFLRISYLVEAQGFELHTQDASFYVLEEGLYRIRTGQSGETELRVIEGSMEAAGENASEVVHALERVVASEGRFIFGPTRMSSRYEDAFSDWNRSRDALLARPVGSGYLPEELGAYERELADGGRWTYESPYGYVWVPHVYHETWRPYSYGRWIWYPVIGYTWVSSYSWGWCVTHYGRWQWRFGMGWYWIPRGGWGPAWVHWYHGSHHYGWCALSYHGYPGVIINNHYYGDRYYGSYPLDSRTMVTVRKSQLQDPNISRVALSRSQARGMGKVQLSSRQPAAGASRAAGMARVATKSSLKTYGRSSASRVSSGTVSRAGGAGSSGRSIGSSSYGTSRSGSSPAMSGRSSTASRTYPSRSGSVSRSAAPQSRTSSRSTSGSSVRSSPGRTTSSTRSTGTYPSRTTRGVVSQRSGSRATSARSYPSRSSVSTSRSPSTSRSSRGAYPSRSSVSTSRSTSAQSRTSARPRAGYGTTRSSSGSRSVRSTPRSATAYSSGSRSRSSYQSRGSSSSRSASRGSSLSSRGIVSSPSRSSGSLGRSSRSTSTSRVSPSRGSSSLRSSGRSARSSGRSAGSARTSSSSRSGSRVRKR